MTGCPFRDIPRAVPAQVQDSGLSAGQGASPSDPWRTEALLADVRNDDHALISQMTALFHTLHNHVIDMIPTTGALAALSPTEREYRRFLCARFVVTLIYRNIIVKDLLALILHPDVYAHYVTANAGLLDGHDADAADSTPVEFTSAVFRFAHAMVRDTYKVNDENSPLSFSDALELSSLRKPSNLPVDTNWAIDWSRFFQIGERVPNHSHRIGPVYTSGALTNSSIFEKLTPLDEDGLPNRDLLTGCFSGLWSVRALSRELRARGLDKLLPDYESWKPIVRDWLAKPAGLFDFDPLSPAEIDILAEDPPLLLFTLIEAGQPIRQATGPINGAAGESLHLGALGSIVVAETILGSLKRAPIAFETAGPHVQDRIREACRTLLDDAGALDSIPEIASMPKLLEYMSDTGALPRQPGGTHIARLNMEERRMPELRERFSVNDEIKWGKLVKSFATGNNYLVENGAPIPLPRTIDDLKTLCANLGIVITMPDYHKGLVIIQSSEEVFSIRLPPKTMVEEMEQFLKDGGKYASPKFYDDFYGTTLTLTTEKEKLDFHAARIGDYSVRMCL
ncbi:MAG: peroxidase family protein [Hyphomicrobiaceae bacterium]